MSDEMPRRIETFDPAGVDAPEFHSLVIRGLLPSHACATFAQQVNAFAVGDALETLRRAARDRGLLPA